MSADSPTQQLIGTILVNKYRISREIGRGGMAAVFEAENIDIGKRVAVKVLSAELITSRIVRERFLREARAAAAIRSPYICDVYDVGEFEDRPFLVMELLEGESLYDRMSTVRRMDIPLTLTVATQTAKGLVKAHGAGVVHRDLKPENLFLTKNEEGEIVTKLLDFGLAKFYAPTDDVAQVRLTREGALFGTPAYMSPEQAKGRGEVDHRSDLWALGCIVYECLTGHTVWNVEQGVAMILAQVASAPIPVPSHLRPDLPPAFDAWFKKALARAPEDRFQTATEFAIALTEALTPESTAQIQTPSLMANIEEVLAQAGLESPAADPAHPVELDMSEPPPSSRRLAPESVPASRPHPALVAAVRRSRHGRAGRRLFSGFTVVVIAVGAFLFAGKYGWSPLTRWAGSRPFTRINATTDRPHDNVETSATARTIGTSQELIAEGKLDEALGTLDRLVQSTAGDPIATSLRSHLKAAMETPQAPCRLAAIGRPRPFDATDPISRPTLLFGAEGVLVAWADNHQDRSKHQVFTVLLDPALRRLTTPLLVSPDASNARFPQLLRAGRQAVLTVWEGTTRQGDLQARFLDGEGRLVGGKGELPALGRAESQSALVPDEDGTFWVFGDDDASDGAEDLVILHLDASLRPIGAAVRLTAFRGDRGLRPGAIHPSAAIVGGKMRIVFTLRQGVTRRVHQMVLPRDGEELRGGVQGGAGGSAGHRFARDIQPLGADGSNSDDARISCSPDNCVVVWSDERAGVVISAMDPTSSEPRFRQEVALRGARPTVWARSGRALATWHEGGRVRVAAVDKTGVTAVGTIGKVSGIHPVADIASGVDINDWLVAWRDFEAAHFEAVVARVHCDARP